MSDQNTNDLAVIENIATESEQIRRRNAEMYSPEVNALSEGMSETDDVRQGDWYLRRIEQIPETATEVDMTIPENLQITVGQTVGSRHIFDSAEGLKLYRETRIIDNVPTDFIYGEVTGPENRVLTHPEHTHVVVPAGCKFEGWQQRELDVTGRIRRVED